VLGDREKAKEIVQKQIIHHLEGYKSKAKIDGNTDEESKMDEMIKGLNKKLDG